MDPVTHGLIGATATQSFADKQKLRSLSFIGFISALLPDLDILIGRSADPLLNLEYHRQFSHALLFIPIGALIATGLTWWFVKKRLNFKQTYLFSLLAYSTAGLADTFTSYGVQLLWPFTDERFNWNLISVFDPLFSIVLVLLVGLAFYKRKQLFAWVGLSWMVVYLSFGFSQHQKAQTLAYELADQRGHQVKQLILKPTIANQLLWSLRYVHTDSLYADGVRLLPFTKPKIYKGQSTQLLNWRQKYARFKGSTMYEDIQRFSTLSEDILIAHPEYDNIIGDGRYAMLPTSLSPLWGIKIDTLNPDQHISFKTYREATPSVRTQFKKMLMGN
ncbi:metal-dependent hydrolase [Fodinibius salsisoli]|uniref:Metal-dependent hydrolase n=1 Tax=Fodinibius salsisoli TaxID=2820877 RepID=A0ABT3PLI6_9BACT|nr:metal-dependent hydrolase [Fodinibius salsisoli]MCW9706819.1 metal-dependent hydrolase [Fodinibius salsisoli]